MKKLLLTLLPFFISVFCYSQLITTDPAFITENAGTIEIIFDASLGTAGLKDYTGTIYAHTGVITSESKSDTDWKYATPTWGDNSEKYKLTSLGNNKWKYVISPSIKEFYEIKEGESVKKLAFVFRSGEKVKGEKEDYYLEGKDLVNGAGRDIFVTVYEQGLNVSFSQPTANQSIKKGTPLDFVISASDNAKIELLINDKTVKTEENATILSYTHTFTSRDDYTVVVAASSNSQIVYDTLYVCVPKTAEYQTRPTGLQDGINYIDNSTVSFVMYAPGKKNIFLIGDFNNWTQLNDYQLKRDGNYWWYTLSDLDKNKLYRFQYVVDDSIRVSDAYTELVLDPWSDNWVNEHYDIYPDMPAYPDGKTYDMVATFQINKPAYNWEVKNFTMPSKTNMVIYELLLRDFTKQKSLQAAIDRLDYLEKLGVTAIELMPIQEFDGNSSWGYNPNHYFAPDKAYGSAEMYKKFIDECHKRGIAVILDVVLNHASGSHPFAKLYWNSAENLTTAENPWFNVYAPHPYSVLHDFNHSAGIVREHFKRMLQYWIEEYKIDGYRLDLSKGITQRPSDDSSAPDYDQDRINYLTEYYEAAKAKNPDIMFILEHFAEWSEEKVLADKGMYLWKNLNDNYSQAVMGYSSDNDFGGMNMTPRNWVCYGESHDEERNFYKAKAYGAGNLKTDSIARTKRAPLNIAFSTLIPGPKMIWQFAEIAYDVESGESGSDIRMEEKPSGFLWFDKYEYRQQAYHNSAKILNLRKQYPNAFDYGELNCQVSQSDWDNGRRIEIKHNDLNMIAVGNFKTTEDAFNGVIDAYPNFSKTGDWYELLTGTKLSVTKVGDYRDNTQQLQPGEVRIYTDRKIQAPDMPHIPEPDGIRELSSDKDTFVYPTVTNGKIFVSTKGELQQTVIYNLHGKLVKTFVQNEKEFDISNLPGGLYILKAVSSTGNSIHKIVKND